jgi:hypothetical protein
MKEKVMLQKKIESFVARLDTQFQNTFNWLDSIEEGSAIEAAFEFFACLMCLSGAVGGGIAGLLTGLLAGIILF